MAMTDHTSPQREPGSDDTETPVLEARSLSKRFGGVQALDDVALRLRAGERHAVVGENGAGKSTLMRIVAGLQRQDAGEVLVDGQPMAASPADARRAGIALVHQELSLVPTLSVAENICLGDLPGPPVLLGRREMHRLAEVALERLGVSLDVMELVERLSLARRQYVEIARALRQSPRVLILDEPTTSLTPPETAGLLSTLRRLSEEGMAILFVSHRLPEIFALCTRATVLRDGRVVVDLDLGQAKPDQMVQSMVGRELAAEVHEAGPPPGSVVLRARGVHASGVHGVDLELRAGEVLGIGGLVGAGRSELVRAMIRLDPLFEGEVELIDDGHAVPLRSYDQALRHGLAFVPEERRSEGVALGLSVAANLALPSIGELSGAFGRLTASRLGRAARPTIETFDIRPPTPDLLVGGLSGGNQQKVALGRWMSRHPKVLILDEPTRGVDVGAKAEVHALVRRAAHSGCAVLMVSSDLPELLALADRIAVMRDGRLTGELAADVATEDAVMRLATGQRAA